MRGPQACSYEVGGQLLELLLPFDPSLVLSSELLSLRWAQCPRDRVLARPVPPLPILSLLCVLTHAAVKGLGAMERTPGHFIDGSLDFLVCSCPVHYVSFCSPGVIIKEVQENTQKSTKQSTSL